MNLKKTIALGLSTLMTLQITPLNIFADETSQETCMKAYTKFHQYQQVTLRCHQTTGKITE